MQQKIKRKKRISHVSIQKIKRKNLLVWVLFHVSMGFISCVEESSLHVSQYSMSAWVLFLVWKNLPFYFLYADMWYPFFSFYFLLHILPTVHRTHCVKRNKWLEWSIHVSIMGFNTVPTIYFFSTMMLTWNCFETHADME